MKTNQKIWIVLALSLLTFAALSPFILSKLGVGGSLSDILPASGKKVNCQVSVLNPAFTDNYHIDKVTCTAQSSVFCELPIATNALSFFKSPDQITIQTSTEGQLPKNNVFTIDDHIITGTLSSYTVNYCIPKASTQVKVSIIAGNSATVTAEKVVNV